MAKANWYRSYHSSLIPNPSSSSVFSLSLWSFYPAVGVADGDHCAEDVVPSLRLHQSLIREHAAVPADVVEAAARLTALVAQPVAGVFDDVDFAVGCVRQAVAACFIVAAGAEHFAVVLGDVKVNGPGSQRVGE